MVNFREVNDDDILKEWLAFREDSLLCQLSDEDYKHGLNFDKFCERILHNVSKDNRLFVQSQLDNRNGVVYYFQIAMGCFDK